ncbi:MAG: hypothetical protein HGB30_13410, partial [Holophagaceae bacterium]|nr:hypothetical protein [Holophagaceae bacterium]
MRRPLRFLLTGLPTVVALALLLGCGGSDFCPECGQNAPILKIDYQQAPSYLAGNAISLVLPNPSGGTPTSYQVTSGSLPGGLTLNASTGIITGTPNTPGVFTVGIQAGNGASQVVQVITLTILPTSPLTLSYGTPREFAAAAAISIQNPSLTNATPGIPTTYALAGGQLPPGLSLGTDGSISGTPTTPAAATTFSIQATNGTRTAVATLSYAISPPGPLVLSYDTPVTFTQGVSIGIQRPTVSNTTPGGISLISVFVFASLPSGLSFNADGTIQGTPTIPGVFTFSVSTTQGARSASTTVTYIVTPSAALLLSYPPPGVMTVGHSIPAQAPAVLNETPGLSSVFALNGTLPSGLNLSSSTGQVTGTPTSIGLYPVTVTATNGSRSANTAVTYTVAPAQALGLQYTSPQVFTSGTSIPVQSPRISYATPGVPTSYAVTGGSLPDGLSFNPS